jgi:rfaE bifunctional protein kinase chain/domain
MAKNLEKIDEIIGRIKGKKVLVVGDLMIDEYLWGAVTRVSPEAPVPIVGVTGETLRLGGAANVAHNIISLGGRVELCGILGNDQMGRWLRSDLKNKEIGTRGIITVAKRPTTVKTRVIAHSQQVVRVDREVSDMMEKADEEVILRSVESFLEGCGCVVVSDYNKGVITPTLMRDLIPIVKDRGIPVAVDPKINHFATYRGVTVLTPNLLEAAAGSGMVIDSLDALVEAGRRIMEKLECQNLVITRGDQGMTVFEGSEKVVHIPALNRHTYDVTGAGDTVVSVLALCLAGGLSVEDGAFIANIAAGLVVGEVGTVPVTSDKLKERTRELEKIRQWGF